MLMQETNIPGSLILVCKNLQLNMLHELSSAATQTIHVAKSWVESRQQQQQKNLILAIQLLFM